VIGVRGSKEEAGHLNVGEHQIQPVKAFQRLNSLHAIRDLDDLETLGLPPRKSESEIILHERRRFPGMVTSIFTRRKSLRSRI
jgi:hypothetical protein